MTDEEAAEKFGLDKETIGIIAKALKIESDNGYLVSLSVTDILHAESSGDETVLAIMAKLFNKNIAPHVSPLMLMQARAYVFLDLPPGAYQEHVRLTCDHKEGMIFSVDPGEIKNPLTKHVPVINDHTQGDDDE